MKRHLAPVVCCLLAVVGLARADTEDSVVRITASVRLPDPTQPWVKGPAVEQFGSGVIIDGQRILTNAHVVSYASDIQVQLKGSEKVDAQVVALSHDLDLAVLKLKDAKLLDKRPALARADKLPKVQDRVAVYGFPIGGNELSITRGEVSRIDTHFYGGRGAGFSIQISAPVNPGNSGGPALVDNKMIGLVVSRVTNAQNIGSVIPNEEIELFLDDIKDGRYDGKPIDGTGTIYQECKNDALRRYLKAGPEVHGVVVQPPRRPDEDYPLRKLDIVTHCGDFALNDQGHVRLKNGMSVYFLYLVPRVARDGGIPLTVWRDGTSTKVTLPVTTRDTRLVGPYTGAPLPYFIHGPLVFAPARTEDITLYSRSNRTLFYDNNPMITRYNDRPRFLGEELVVVSAPLFPHKISRGYANPVGKVVRDVNDTPVKNLRHLVELLRDSKDETLRFRFHDAFSEILVFERAEIERATEEIFEDHGILPTRRGSAEMLQVWRGRAEEK